MSPFYKHGQDLALQKYAAGRVTSAAGDIYAATGNKDAIPNLVKRVGKGIKKVIGGNKAQAATPAKPEWKTTTGTPHDIGTK